MKACGTYRNEGVPQAVILASHCIWPARRELIAVSRVFVYGYSRSSSVCLDCGRVKGLWRGVHSARYLRFFSGNFVCFVSIPVLWWCLIHLYGVPALGGAAMPHLSWYSKTPYIMSWDNYSVGVIANVGPDDAAVQPVVHENGCFLQAIGMDDSRFLSSAFVES